MSLVQTALQTTSEYHKIETLYERDDKTHRIKPELILKNRVYGCIKTWHWTEKVDGTNVRVIWDGSKVTFGGKTDNAQLHADLFRYLTDTFTPEKLAACFEPIDGFVVLYGEGYGAGIQKGGNYSQEKRFILFDILVGKWWLNQDSVNDVASKLGIPVVPFLGEMTLEDATEKVRHGIPSVLAEGRCQMEGMVGRPVEALFDKKGHRLIVKLKTKDFLGSK